MKILPFILFTIFIIAAANAQNSNTSRNTAHTGSVPNGNVAALGTCNSGKSGNIANVSDALTPVVGSTVVGSGAVTTLVHCNGSNWIVG